MDNSVTERPRKICSSFNSTLESELTTLLISFFKVQIPKWKMDTVEARGNLKLSASCTSQNFDLVFIHSDALKFLVHSLI